MQPDGGEMPSLLTMEKDHHGTKLEPVQLLLQHVFCCWFRVGIWSREGKAKTCFCLSLFHLLFWLIGGFVSRIRVTSSVPWRTAEPGQRRTKVTLTLASCDWDADKSFVGMQYNNWYRSRSPRGAWNYKTKDEMDPSHINEEITELCVTRE